MENATFCMKVGSILYTCMHFGEMDRNLKGPLREYYEAHSFQRGARLRDAYVPLPIQISDILRLSVW
jgi:hypothetical protein